MAEDKEGSTPDELHVWNKDIKQWYAKVPGKQTGSFIRAPKQWTIDGEKFYRWGESESKLTFESERHELQKQLTDTIQELNTARRTHKETKEIHLKLEETYNKLEAKEKISHILSRINENGRQKVLENKDFLDLFQDKTPCDSVVVSIDIRRSTELMLKARKPELFSEFITALSHKLSDCIIENYGIFDKFTGDGILAFFPNFYSGEQAIIRAIKASEECHKIFDDHYNNSRHCFSVFIKDVGLGIGIDYGNVTLVNTTNELTVVGIPVVYACRMSGAQAGQTILNQPAKEEVERLNKKQTKFIETEINIKNEGKALAYMVELNPSIYETIKNPQWTIKEKIPAISVPDIDGKKPDTSKKSSS